MNPRSDLLFGKKNEANQMEMNQSLQDKKAGIDAAKLGWASDSTQD